MKLTEKEIAKECNVSITTVSRALNNKGRISKKTRDKILAYVEEKQTQIYTQNFCKKTIGLIVPNIQNEYYATMITTIQEHFQIVNMIFCLLLQIKTMSKNKMLSMILFIEMFLVLFI